MPTLPHLDHLPEPWLPHHSGIAESGVSTPPWRHAGCTPLQTPGLGAPRFRPRGWGRRPWVTKTAHLSRFCMWIRWKKWSLFCSQGALTLCPKTTWYFLNVEKWGPQQACVTWNSIFQEVAHCTSFGKFETFKWLMHISLCHRLKYP